MAEPTRYHRGPTPSMHSVYTQMWPPKPAFTEKDVPDLQGKVYIVTGGSSGVGREVVRILYGRNAKVYVGARSEERASQAMKHAQDSSPNSKGALNFLHMDFTDLRTIQSAVESLKTREKQLHALFNNAGVQSASKDAAQTVQGWELHFGVNCLAPFLLTHLLTPLMLSTAGADQDVRVVWVCSLSVEMLGEKSRGISSDYLEYYPKLSALERYGVSKAGSWLHGVEMARRFPQITSIPCNPGHLKSDLYREQNKCLQGALNMAVLYPPVYGALTELAAVTSPTVSGKDSGRWMIPWGRWGQIRPDLMDATRPQSEGGNGHAKQFWDWCLEQVAPYTG